MSIQKFFEIMHSDESQELIKASAKFAIDNCLEDIVPYGYANTLNHTVFNDPKIRDKLITCEPFTKLLPLFDGVQCPGGTTNDTADYLKYQVWIETIVLWRKVDPVFKDPIKIIADTPVDNRPGYDFLMRIDGVHKYEPTEENRDKIIDYIKIATIYRGDDPHRLSTAIDNRDVSLHHCAFSPDWTSKDIIANVDEFTKCFKEWLDGITAKYTIESIYKEFVAKTIRWDNQFAIFAKNQFDVETALKARDMCQEMQEQLFDLDTMMVAFDTSDPKYCDMLNRMAGVVESIYNSDTIFDDVCCIRQALVEMCDTSKKDEPNDNKEA